MASEILKRDGNRVPVLGAITNDANEEIRMLRVDPATGRLLIAFDGYSNVLKMPYIYYRNHTAVPNTGGGTATITPTPITAGIIDGTNKSFITVTFMFGFGATSETKTLNCTLYDGTNTLSPAAGGFTTTATSQSGRCSFEFYRNSATTATANGSASIGQGASSGSLNRYAGNAGTPGAFDWLQALTITVTANSTTSGNIALNNVVVILS